MLSQLWKMIMLFFLLALIPGQQNKGEIFLYSRQDLKPITTNIQGFFTRKNCIRNQNHNTKSEPEYRIQEYFKISSLVYSPLHYVKSFSPSEVIPQTSLK